MLLPQFAIIPLAVVLVWVGLSRGIAPLNRLQSLIRRRRPTDLSPVEPSSVPEEVRPLIVAYNDMMARLEENLQAQQRWTAAKVVAALRRRQRTGASLSSQAIATSDVPLARAARRYFGTMVKAREAAGIHIRRHRYFTKMDTQDFFAASDIRVRHHDLAVETTGAQQRRVKHVRTVGCSDQDDAFVRFKPIHFNKELV